MEMVLPEIIAAGIYNSQVVVKNTTITRNRKTTMFEIELPLTKTGGISYIDNEQSLISPDIIICAKPGQVRHTKLPFMCYYIHLIVKHGSLYDLLMGMPSFLKTEKSKKYKDLFLKIIKYEQSPLKSDKIILNSLILELIYMLNSDAEKQTYLKNEKHNSNYIINNVIKYIKDNLSEDLSLTALSSYANLSPIHFHNTFKASTGKTLREYVESERIKKACDLLVTTDYTLTRISEECGFSSQSYFSFAFRRKMNLTPREYAKRIFNKYEANY